MCEMVFVSWKGYSLSVNGQTLTFLRLDLFYVLTIYIYLIYIILREGEEPSLEERIPAGKY